MPKLFSLPAICPTASSASAIESLDRMIRLNPPPGEHAFYLRAVQDFAAVEAAEVQEYSAVLPSITLEMGLPGLPFMIDRFEKSR